MGSTRQPGGRNAARWSVRVHEGKSRARGWILIFLTTDEAGQILEEYLVMFRQGMFELTYVGGELLVEDIKRQYDLCESDGREAYFQTLSVEGAHDFMNGALCYLQARDWFLKEMTGFTAVCGELTLSPDAVRLKLREEETLALSEGGMDGVNLYEVREIFRDIMHRVDAAA